MKTMFSNDSIDQSLRLLGQRLRAARLAKGDSQAAFSVRLGISVPTLRDMEQGSPTVSVGTWGAALWVLSRLRDLDGLLEERESLFAQLERPRRVRQRAPQRPRKSA